MKAFSKVVQALMVIVGVLVFGPIKWIWRAVPGFHLLVGSCCFVAFLAFETITPAYWLALAEYYEARGEDFSGRYAVMNVVLNRVEDERWPDSVKGVVNGGLERGESCDFSFMCDGKPEDPWLDDEPWEEWLQIKAEAWGAIIVDTIGLRRDPTGGAVFYKRHDAKSAWFDKQIKAGKMEKVPGDFGAHEFFR
ncbi:cell wall hydrolase [Patescibacteria group bacterium]